MVMVKTRHQASLVDYEKDSVVVGGEDGGREKGT